MCSVSRLGLLLVAFAACARAEAKRPEPLRVCADPNNLPFSDKAGNGFENALATLIAKDLGTTVEYTWLPQRRGFIRNTLKAKKCDVVIGVPARFEMAATTRPYYRSSYVFVTRADRKLDIKSFDDARLKTATIGIHAVGDDYAAVPPAHELASHGLADRVVGFSIYGDYSKAHPPGDLIDAVASGTIDVAIAWGPLAGYFARRSKVPLQVTPIDSQAPGMTFSIALGVRKDDRALHDSLERVLARRQRDIAKLLARFGVPLLPVEEVKR
jgi:quinoprotein dehydrogenase-associated probable ABC transporter substrate-binding protein